MAVIDRERWQRLEPLLDQALDLSLDERSTWLDSLRTSAPDIAADLSALLAGDAIADDRGFLSRPIEVTLAGLEIGAYTLERPLGHGGMGSVWLARRTDGRFEGLAALKLLNLSLVSAEGQQRFRREGSVLARLTHPGIARLLDAGVSASGQPYLVLEHVDGEHIDVFAEKHKLSIEDRVRLLLKVLDAVGHAHANLIVHRDLKPSNILVTADGSVKLLDFGIAKLLDKEGGGDGASLTIEGSRSFTPEFAAPEQVRGDAITTATDVYAAGVLLYLLVSGKHPTAKGCRTQADAVRALLEVQPARIGSGDLGIVIDKALRKDAVDRYATVAAFADDLRRWLRHEPISARPQSLGYRARKFARRNRAAALAVVAGVLLTAVYIATIIVDRERVRRALAEANVSASKAEQVTDFTVGLFEASGDERVLTDTVSARELLRHGVARAHELSGQPLIEAQMLDLIGRIRTRIGDYGEARAALDEALAIRQRELGAEHPDVAASLMSLGSLIVAVNAQDGAAVPLFKQAMELRTHLFGELDPRTTDAVYEYATSLHMSGNFRAARPVFERWLAAIKQQPPLVTPERATQIKNYSSILEYSGQPERAERLSREVLSMDIALYGERHPRVGSELLHLGGILTDERKRVEADTVLRRAIAILRAAFSHGPSDELGNALRNHGYLLNDLQQWDAAEATWREAASDYRGAQGIDGVPYANAMSQVGHVQVERGQYAIGEQTLRDALRLKGMLRPPPNPVAVRTRMWLGEALRQQGKLAEAEPLLLAGFRGPTLLRGTREYAARALAKLYDAEGRADEAAKYRLASNNPIKTTVPR
jgi:eukaryotic-like serine/threonine-protein kinase